MDIQLDKVSVGDLINFGLAIIAFSALYIQRKTFRLSKRDLQLKVNNLEDILQKIDLERITRETQIDQTLTKHYNLEATAYTIHNQMMQITSVQTYIIYNQLSSINLMINFHSKLLSDIIISLNVILQKMSEEDVRTKLPTIEILEKIIQKTTSYIQRNNHWNEFQDGIDEIKAKYEAPIEKSRGEARQKIAGKYEFELDMFIKKKRVEFDKIDADFKIAVEEMQTVFKKWMDDPSRDDSP